MSNEKRQIENRKLYRYIQQAFEYVRGQSQEVIHGSPKDVLDKLNRIYKERLDSVFGEDETDNDNTSFEPLTIWLDQKTKDNKLDIISVRNNDVEWENGLQNEDKLTEAYAHDDVEELGTDVYATYLPIHFFFDGSSFDTHWGIYMSEQGIQRLAAVLKRQFIWHFGEGIRASGFLEMAYQILLRHELEHFKIESFALNAQLFLGRPVYTPYLTNVYTETYPFNACLEEGLANSTVLASRKIESLFNELYPQAKDNNWHWQNIVCEVFFDRQAHDCYRNYSLRHGWAGAEQAGMDARREAMNYLCNQIVDGRVQPLNTVPFYAFPPDNHFLRQEELVPIHIVRNVDNFSFIRVPTPKQKVWEKFLRSLSYVPTDQGKGDHRVWVSSNSSLPQVTVNYRKAEVEWGSFKNTLKSLNIRIAEFQRWQSSGQLPQHLTQASE